MSKKYLKDKYATSLNFNNKPFSVVVPLKVQPSIPHTFNTPENNFRVISSKYGTPFEKSDSGESAQWEYKPCEPSKTSQVSPFVFRSDLSGTHPNIYSRVALVNNTAAVSTAPPVPPPHSSSSSQLHVKQLSSTVFPHTDIKNDFSCDSSNASSSSSSTSSPTLSSVSTSSSFDSKIDITNTNSGLFSSSHDSAIQGRYNQQESSPSLECSSSKSSVFPNEDSILNVTANGSSSIEYKLSLNHVVNASSISSPNMISNATTTTVAPNPLSKTKKKKSNSHTHQKSSGSFPRKRKKEDNLLPKNCKFSKYEIVDTPIDTFNKLLEKLPKDQRMLFKDSRRKGKNRGAARRARDRRIKQHHHLLIQKEEVYKELRAKETELKRLEEECKVWAKLVDTINFHVDRLKAKI